MSRPAGQVVVRALQMPLRGLSHTQVWRWAVAISFAAAVVRSGSGGGALPQVAWYFLQFTPLLVAGIVESMNRSIPPRRVDTAVLIVMALYGGFALLSTLTSLFRATTFEQAGLLLFMFGFLAVTLTRRWSSMEVVRGDLALIVGLVVGAQLVGLVGLLTHKGWAIADYGRFEGVFTNANYAGIISTIALAVGAYLGTVVPRWRLMIVVVSVPLAVALVLSGSRGALLGLGAGIASLGLLRARRNVVILVAIAGSMLAAALVLAPYIPPTLAGPFSRTLQSSDITSGRLQIYTNVLGHWSRAPLLGTGYRTTELLTGPKRFTGHDVYLSVLTETGIVGATVFATLLTLIFVGGPRSVTQRALLGPVVTVLTIELTESSLFGWGSPISLPEWLILLAFLAAGRNEVLSRAGAAWRPNPPPSYDVAAGASIRTI